MLVRSKPFTDAEELLPVCFRCGASNPLLNPQVGSILSVLFLPAACSQAAGCGSLRFLYFPEVAANDMLAA